MKKLLALTLVLLMAVSMFAACGDQAADPTQAPAGDTTAPQVTEPQVTEPAATDPVATDPVETEPVADEKYVVIDKLSKHENGWNQDKWENGSYGIFFSAKTNDAPFNGEEYVYYRPVSEDVIKLYRDGEVYDLGDPLVDFLNKQDRNGYYLRFEEWMIRDYFPITNGDVIYVEGDFVNEENGYTIHIDPVYMILNGDLVKFSQTAPEGIE